MVASYRLKPESEQDTALRTGSQGMSMTHTLLSGPASHRAGFMPPLTTNIALSQNQTSFKSISLRDPAQRASFLTPIDNSEVLAISIPVKNRTVMETKPIPQKRRSPTAQSPGRRRALNNSTGMGSSTMRNTSTQHNDTIYSDRRESESPYLERAFRYTGRHLPGEQSLKTSRFEREQTASSVNTREIAKTMKKLFKHNQTPYQIASIQEKLEDMRSFDKRKDRKYN